MHPSDCPFWEYAHHPQRVTILQEQTAKLLWQLRDRQLDSLTASQDSRPIHAQLFSQLTPPDYPYYAGHYRGEPLRCLQYANVGITDDPRVGAFARLVDAKLKELNHYLNLGFTYLDQIHQLPDTDCAPEDKLLSAIAFACAIFDEFLRIHPYLNGNGHIARFLVWVILGRYGYWPSRFPIDPRPDRTLYMNALLAYRNGDKDPLEQYLLECIIGEDL